MPYIHQISICAWIPYRKPNAWVQEFFIEKWCQQQEARRKGMLNKHSTQIIYYMFTIVIQIYYIYNSVKFTWFHWGKRNSKFPKVTLWNSHLIYRLNYMSSVCIYVYNAFIYNNLVQREKSNQTNFFSSVSNIFSSDIFSFRSEFEQFSILIFLLVCGQSEVFVIFSSFQTVGNNENTVISISLTSACNELFRENSLWWFGVKALFFIKKTLRSGLRDSSQFTVEKN